MKNQIVLALAVAGVLVLGACGPEPKPVPASTQSRVVGYFVDWGVYDRGFHVRMVDGGQVTHLNYAFAVIGSDNTIQLLDPNADVEKIYGDEPAGVKFHGNLAALLTLKAKYPGLRTMISVGGWTKSRNFSSMAAGSDSRKAFADSAAAFVEKYGFDGIDLDWEYPVEGGLETNLRSPADRDNLTKVVKDLRVRFDQAEAKDGRHREISLAVTGNPAYVAHLDLKELGKYLDFADLMAYDYFVGPAGPARHQSALKPNPADPAAAAGKPEARFTVEGSVQAYLDGGFPAAKLVVGVPFYGRGWLVEPGTPDGLYAPALAKLPKGTWEAGNFDYDDLNTRYLKADPAGVKFDEKAQASYYYDPKAGLFVSYDSERAVEAKARWIVDHHLGGAMFWEFSGDRERKLTAPLARVLLGR